MGVARVPITDVLLLELLRFPAYTKLLTAEVNEDRQIILTVDHPDITTGTGPDGIASTEPIFTRQEAAITFVTWGKQDRLGRKA